MEYVNLRETDLEVSRLGFGCCPMGGHGWGKVSKDDFRDAVAAALDHGVNFFDTADIYGYGESERSLGQFLAGRRKDAVVATKGGVRINDQGETFYDTSPAWIEKALDESLTRLGTDYIDLYQIHYLDGKTALSETFETLEKKRKEGKIRFWGISNVSPDKISGLSLPKALVSFQMEYSLANRSNEKEILRLREEQGLEFLSWGSLGQGVLTGIYGAETKFADDDRRSRPIYVNFHGERLQKNIAMVEQIKVRFGKSGKTSAQIAIRWILDHLGFGVVLTGIKRPQQLYENIAAFGWRLTEQEREFLDELSKPSVFR